MSRFYNKKEIAAIYYVKDRTKKAIAAMYYVANGLKRVIWQAVRSCFGSGTWNDEKPWQDDECWKD